MDFIEACIAANREIYALLNSDADLRKECKRGFGGDISLKADLEAEAIFIKHLQKFGRIYSEESGSIGEGKDNIIIDPLDGSKNFAANIPYFGSSCALEKEGKVTCAVIANFAAGYMQIKYERRFERRFFLDDRVQKITASPLCGVGIFEKAYDFNDITLKLKQASLKCRSLGALALSLALSHETDFVLFGGNIREFDIAAGWYMSEDLHRLKTKDLLLVSKDKGIFDKIRDFMTRLDI
ncbi:MAG: inositol monophosphatase [Campylobacteraceae bacterium]|jgi:myo-inositol-1(or 4)-monophosphatase|nr:inositol monophosphatase [Campylobacteraceae bacterium]